MLFLFVLVNCSPTFYLKTQADPNYDFANCRSVVIYGDQESIEGKKFKRMLESELKSIGLKIIEGTDDANVSSTYIIDLNEGSYTGSLLLPTTSITTGQVGSIKYSENTTSSQIVPYTGNYSYKNVLVRFINKQDNSVVWQCYISIDSRYYDQNILLCLQKSLSLFGKDFQGEISLY
jgi:hypothetical protein